MGRMELGFKQKKLKRWQDDQGNPWLEDSSRWKLKNVRGELGRNQKDLENGKFFSSVCKNHIFFDGQKMTQMNHS